MNNEVTRQRIEIIREKAAAARRIADMQLAMLIANKESEDAHKELVFSLDSDEQERLNATLQKEIPELYKKLLYAPASERLKEIVPLSSPNGTSFWRDLEIGEFGQINVRYEKSDENETGASYFSIDVGNLPIAPGQSLAKESVLIEFKPGQSAQDPSSSPEMENINLLGQRKTLSALCEAASISLGSE